MEGYVSIGKLKNPVIYSVATEIAPIHIYHAYFGKSCYLLDLCLQAETFRNAASSVFFDVIF